MKKINKGKVKKELKKDIILVFIGFMLGMIYYHTLIKEDTVLAYKEPLKEEVKEEVEEEPIEEEVEYVFEEFCYLDEVSCKIKKAAENYNIDWKMAIAISKHETGNYTSYAFKSLNNVGGMMYWNGVKSVLKSFNSLDEGIDAYVSNLKRNYYDIGLTTIEEIQTKYAPIGATNDPNNLNSYWVKGVYNYYYSLEK